MLHELVIAAEVAARDGTTSRKALCPSMTVPMELSIPPWTQYAALINIGVILLIAIVAKEVVGRAFDHHLRKAITSERRTGITFLRNGVKTLIFFSAGLAIIYSIPPLRSLAVGVFAGASILAAVFGFASQHAFSNIISGVFIVLFKPFRVDDIIKINGEIGTVEDITLRHTVIRALENKRLIYPNSVIDREAIINWTIRDEKAQKYMWISIDYEADLARAIQIIEEEGQRHPDVLDMRSDEERAAGVPVITVVVHDLERSMVNFRVSVWVKDLPVAMRTTWDLYRKIKLRFDAEGIRLGRPSQIYYPGHTEEERSRVVPRFK